VHDQLEGVEHRPQQAKGAGREEADANGSIGDSMQGFGDRCSYIRNSRGDILRRDLNVVSPPIRNKLVRLVSIFHHSM